MFFLLYGDQISDIADSIAFSINQVFFFVASIKKLCENLQIIPSFLFSVVLLVLIQNFEERCKLDKTIIRYTPSVSQHK